MSLYAMILSYLPIMKYYNIDYATI